MARPTVIVEFSPGSIPLSTSRSWVDITRRVLSAEWTWGAQRDGSDFPGEATIVLTNHDRLFDPDNTAGTYFGDLLPRVPFRIRTTGSVTADLFYGYVEDGWEQEFEPPRGGICTIRLVDLITVLEGYTLPGVLEHAILAEDPLGFWPLTDETTGVKDLGSGSNDGTPTENPAFGSPELIAGLEASVDFDGQGARIDISRSTILPDTLNASLFAIFETSMAGAVAVEPPIFVQSDGNALAVVRCFVVYLFEDGTLHLDSLSQGVGVARGTVEAVNDGAPHTLWALNQNGVVAGLGIDTATITDNDVISAREPGANGVAIGGSPFATASATDNQWEGRISHVAIWDGLVDTTGRQSILDASSSLAGLRSDEQIAWALDRIGVPAGLRNLDEGRAVMGAAYTAGVDAMTFIQEVTATEAGAFYVDHGDGGKLRFTERYTAFLATRSTVSQATFSDDPAESYDDVVRVERGQVVVEANGVRTIINQATVTWRGGQQTDQDAASIAAYGPRGRTIDTQAGTASQALGVAQWTVLLESQPRTRIRELQLNPAGAETAFPTALGLRPADLITVRSQPAGTGSVDTRELLVAGVAHNLEGRAWETSYFTGTSPAEGVSLFILGTSELDGTDVLAF